MTGSRQNLGTSSSRPSAVSTLDGGTPTRTCNNDGSGEDVRHTSCRSHIVISASPHSVAASTAPCDVQIASPSATWR